ncbi:iron ABC transporter permease [Verticiella sediminum]|uniref:Iron ABC transporter permease n=1 Tax=Verticiella sediminum TaxID=1247510 RepID=A0A556AY21_9BURK|nr:iron ABC transporter permease [Verticiella sediminum]
MRARGRVRAGDRAWLAPAVLTALLVALPLAALAVAAARGGVGHWAQLAGTVLGPALRDTAVLLAGVGAIAVLLGAASAWLVTAHEFPGRRVLSWALLLPLAMPTYIVAYAYLDLLHPIGPVQGAIRALLGYDSPRQFRLPDVRSMWACILLLGCVLYPYVYVTVRAMFLMQAASLVEAARTLGARPLAVFWRIGLPAARPAVAVGASLALMEALNDIGASEFLGVRTLTVTVYTTWITRSDLAGAAQLALAMLLLVVLLIVAERRARRRLAYAASANAPRRLTPIPLRGTARWVTPALLFVPVLLGFLAPGAYLLDAGLERYLDAGISPALWRGTGHTLALAAAATILTLCAGLALAYGARVAPGAVSRALQRIGSLGYAVPGTVLAIGLLTPLLAFDHWFAGVLEAAGMQGVGLVLLGSGTAIVLACTVRFLAIAAGSVEAGLARLPGSLDAAARSLGQGPGGLLWRVHLPLLSPALAAAALLVFIDCMKELPATLLLRPLNIDTLATLLYAEAARGAYEDGALAALFIVIAGLLPVVLLARVGEHRRTGPAGASAPATHGLLARPAAA